MNTARTYSIEAIMVKHFSALAVGKQIRVNGMRKPRICLEVDTCNVLEGEDDNGFDSAHIALQFHFENGTEVVEIDSEIDIVRS